MKFIVATYGTEGDARPFAALCRSLMDAGHEARLLADPATLGTAQALGVPTTALGGNIRNTLFGNDTASSVVTKGGGFNATARVLAKIATENAESWLGTIVAAASGYDAVLAAGLAAFVGFSAAEYLGIKSIGSGMIPITPTSEFPSPFLPSKWVPRALNRTSQRFVNAMLWNAFRGKTNAARAKLGLPPRTAVWKDLPMAYGVSPTLLPQPADWPEHVHLCGQWVVPANDWVPTDELARFMADGEAPVYIGFGSMSGFDSPRLLDMLIRATNGRRVLLNPGWSGIDPSGLPGNVLVIGDTPHDWLFPRVSIVIHHGGSGTSHSATRAGVPSIVIPFAGDQFFWAERLRITGVAPKPLDARKLTMQEVRAALDFTATRRVRNQARTMGEMMHQENGVRNAVGILERLMES